MYFVIWLKSRTVNLRISDCVLQVRCFFVFLSASSLAHWKKIIQELLYELHMLKLALTFNQLFFFNLCLSSDNHLPCFPTLFPLGLGFIKSLWCTFLCVHQLYCCQHSVSQGTNTASPLAFSQQLPGTEQSCAVLFRTYMNGEC